MDQAETRDLLFNGQGTPCVLLDTTDPSAERLFLDEPRAVETIAAEQAGACGTRKDADVRAVVLNISATHARGQGELRVWASGAEPPKNATLGFGLASQNSIAGLVVFLDKDSEIQLLLTEEADVRIELAGYYSGLDLRSRLTELREEKASRTARPDTPTADGAFANLTVSGDLSMTASATKYIKGTQGNLTFQTLNDAFGSVKMSLQNRFGVNGVLFEQATAGALIDFVLKGGSAQRNIRMDARGGANQILAGAGPEFQFGYPKGVGTGPNLVVADSAATFLRGNLGVGTASPSYKLDVAGNLNLNKGNNNGAALYVDDFDALTFDEPNGSFIWGASALGNEFPRPVGVGRTASTINMLSVHAGPETGTEIGISGFSDQEDGTGVFGYATTGTNAYGIYGASDNGLAGYFSGNVSVTGTLSKGGGSFKIDHPLDPANQYLYHSFVESPDMMNLYTGIASLDEKGAAVVVMPKWFDTLNRDFRYQLTAVGAPGPGLYIAEGLANNQFRIAGGQPGAKVSWQITGIRQDPWANAHRIPVEQDKPAQERGYYLHPDLYGQPRERGIEWANKPKTMRSLQAQGQP